MIALAVIAAGCLIGGPIVDQIADLLPNGAAPKLAAPVFVIASAVDLGCMIVSHNPWNSLELAGHVWRAHVALRALGVRGEAEIRSGLRGSNPWIQHVRQ